MRVRVLFFGVLKDLVGRSSESLELPDGARVRDLLAHYLSEAPRMRDSLASIAVAVNHEYAGPEVRLKSEDEVGLLPPVSGWPEYLPMAAPCSSERPSWSERSPPY